ncbi:MAG: tRNA 2-thiouridine(34) synthase MnmA [Acidimicrobiia bacterium]|nr:tRNA 2-thiouridine(34) synthase MnmA [bacterium]MXX64063.1 tRNA 2-thiouridine(34) synthase MnmA [Acidimicrobiia bacterium]
MKALVAMSGGVDSSVAAALMKEEGWEVMGVTMKLWQGPGGEAPTAGCCTVSDAEDARRVAAQLDIPYYVWDYTEEFMSGVVEGFVEDYATGRTPNPCIECNRTVKFTNLLAHAEALGYEVVVTGHYARVTSDSDGYHLWRGVDPRKDQSYVLSMLGQQQLARLRFPVGELTKEETRKVASRLGIRTADKPDSQDICFVGQGDYRQFLGSRGVTPIQGPILHRDGRMLGVHHGITNFTIGQRRGLGVAVGEPLYVFDLDEDSATVMVGDLSDLAVDQVTLTRLSWINRPVTGEVLAQYRAHGRAVPSEISVQDDQPVIRFSEPQQALAKGQTVSLYRDNQVVGGGIIESTHYNGTPSSRPI